MAIRSTARLLAGTSVAALAVGLALGATRADHVVNPNPGGSFTNIGDIDYLFIDVDHDTITNAGTIEPGWSAPHDAQPDPYPDDSVAVGITVQDAEIDGDIVNTVDGEIMVTATETAFGIFVQGGEVTGSIINNGLIDVDVDGPSALAIGVVHPGSEDEDEVVFINTGAVNVTAFDSDTDAVAAAAVVEGGAGVQQGIFFTGTGDVAAIVDNSGTIDVAATTLATSTGGFASADVTGGAIGILQFVAALNGDALASVDNSNSLTVTVLADADGDTGALAEVNADVAGIDQEVSASGDATATVDNSGTIAVDVTALADAVEGAAQADIGEISGISQFVEADGAASADVDNSGTLSVSVLGEATGASADADFGTFTGTVTGIYQDVSGDEAATASVTNGGAINVDVEVRAVATEAEANAFADATGIHQFVDGGEGGLARIINNGEVMVHVDVDTQGVDFAQGGPGAFGGHQELVGSGTVVFHNTGLFAAEADGWSDGAVGSGAGAHGLNMRGAENETLVIDFFNSGTLSALTIAESVGDGPATAGASAVGLFLRAHTVQGEFHNTGTVQATAIASASATTTPDDPFPSGAGAGAFAMDIEVDSFDAALHNDGADAEIIAYAQAFAEPGAVTEVDAVAIQFFPGRLGDSQEDAAGLLVNNSGMIWAGESLDGGATITRATAISTAEAPSLIHQQWKGETHWGRIFGDVIIKEAETITVLDGVTKLNGIVNNPDFVPVLPISVLDADYPFVGTMVIEPSGTLFLAMWDPCFPVGGFGGAGCPQLAPQVNVDTFIQEDGASLWFEINAPPDATPVPAGPPDDFIGQINADHAEIDGEVAIRVVQPQVFPNSSRYEDVVVATTGEGQWDTETSFSPLLTLDVDYTEWDDTGGGGEIHFDVDRVAFDAADLSGVGGFTKNKLAVAGGLEGAVEDVLDGDTPAEFELLMGTLFTLNASEYRHALNQLEGAIHPQTLWSVTNSLDLFKRAENARMKYGPGVYVVPFGAPDTVVYKDPVPFDEPVHQPAAPGALWLNAQGTWADVDGDENAPGFDHQRRSIHGGADYMVHPGLTLGLAGGYFAADLDFDHDGEIDYDGFQVGGYGKYDWENWYINALGAYGSYSGNSRRSLVIDRHSDPMECGCIPDIGLASTNKGDFDADAWMVSGEFGHRFQWSELGWVAPYAGLTYQRGEIDTFTETADGTASASALRIGGTGESLVSDLGVRAAHGFAVGEASTANLEFRVAWLHEFGDNPHSMDASFAGVPSSGFKVVGSDISRDTLALDAGLSFDMTQRLEVGVSYNGRFNSDLTESGVMGRVVYNY